MSKIIFLFFLSWIIKILAVTPQTIQFTPQGNVKSVTQVSALFDTPQVAVTQLNQIAKKSVFKIKCPYPGKAFWTTTKTWVFQFDAPLPPGVRCSFKPLLSHTSHSSQIFQFEVEKSSIDSLYPYHNTNTNYLSQVSTDQTFVLNFNAPYKKEDVLKNTHFVVDGIDEQIPIEIVEGPLKKEILSTTDYRIEQLFKNQIQNPAEKSEILNIFNRAVVIKAKRNFPHNHIVKLIYDTESFIYRVKSPFTATFSCQREKEESTCLPILGFTLNFTSDVPIELVKKIKLVHPASKKIYSPNYSSYDESNSFTSTINFKGPFVENSEYIVEIPQPFTNDEGEILSNASSFPLKIKTGGAPALAKFSGDFGILEKNASPTLPITLRHIEKNLLLQLIHSSADPGIMASIKSAFTHFWANIRNETVHLSKEQRVKKILTWLKKIRGEGSYGDWQNRDRSLFKTPLIKEKDDQIKRVSITKPLAASKMEVVGIPLPDPGFYLIELESQKLGAALIGKKKTFYVKTSALVTNLNISFKRGSLNSMAFITSLDKAKPQKEVRVSVWNSKGEKRAEGITNEKGIVFFDGFPISESWPTSAEEEKHYFSPRDLFIYAETDDDFTFTFTNWDEGINRWNFNESEFNWDQWRKDFRGQTVFDRTLLRVGETLHMKHILRKKGIHNLTYPTQTPFNELRIVQWASGQDFRLPLQFDQQGVAETVWKIPETAKLGTYSVYIQQKGNDDMSSSEIMETGQFELLELRVPLMKAVVKGPESLQSLINPDSIPLDIQLHYLSGGFAGMLPLTLNYQFLPLAGKEYPMLEGFLFNKGSVPPLSNESSQPENLIASLAGKTDTQGQAFIDIKTPNLSKNLQNLKTVFQYKDPNGEIQSVVKNFTLYPASTLIAARIVPHDVDVRFIPLEIRTINLQGEGVPKQPFSITLYKDIYKSHRKKLIGGIYSYEHSSTRQNLGTLYNGQTDQSGKSLCQLPITEKGDLLYEVKTVDEKGRESFTYLNHYISPSSNYWFKVTDNNRMDIIPDKKSYAPGETATIQLQVPFHEFTLLTTVEHEGIIESFVNEFHQQKPLVKIPIKTSYSPNVFISMMAFRGRVADAPPTAMVDLAKPAFKMGVTHIKVGWEHHKLQVNLKTSKKTYRTREKVDLHIKITSPHLKTLHNAEVAVAVVDEALLELKKNQSFDLLSTMMSKRNHGVDSSTANLQIVGKRHYGLKAVPQGGDGGKGLSRELFDTLIFWKGRVKLNPSGEASLTFPLNDSLSSFKIMAVATAKEDLFGMGETTINSTQEVLIFAGTPPLAREGDQFKVNYTLRNTTNHKISMTATLTTNPTLSFTPKQIILNPKESKNITWNITIPSEIKQMIYTLFTKGLVDKTAIQDTLITKQTIKPQSPLRIISSELYSLNKKLTIPLTPPQSKTTKGSILFTAESSLTALLQKSLRNFMQNYPYSCLEQQISKYTVLGDQKGWDKLLQELPTYFDGQTNLLRFFPISTLNGDPTLTTYFLKVASYTGQTLYDPLKKNLLTGIKSIAEGNGKIMNPNLFNDYKLMALSTLSLFQKLDSKALDELKTATAETNHSQLIDLYTIWSNSPHHPKAKERKKELEREIMNRLIIHNGVIQMKESRSYPYQSMLTSLEGEMLQLIFVLMRYNQKLIDQQKEQFFLGITATAKQGHWPLTTDNTWAGLFLKNYAQLYESTAVSGKTTISPKVSTTEFNWDSGLKEYQANLPWTPSIPKEVEFTHHGPGTPWLKVEINSNTPSHQLVNSAFTFSKKIESLVRKKAGQWQEGDIVKVTLNFTPKLHLGWVALTDPIPAGASILRTDVERYSTLHQTEQEGREGLTTPPSFIEKSFESYRAYYESVTNRSYSISYIIRVNQKGTFHLPPTRIEALYQPQINGEWINKPFYVQ